MMGGQLIAGVFGSGIATLAFIYVCDCCTERVREFCLTNCWAVWYDLWLIQGIGLDDILSAVLFYAWVEVLSFGYAVYTAWCHCDIGYVLIDLIAGLCIIC